MEEKKAEETREDDAVMVSGSLKLVAGSRGADVRFRGGRCVLPAGWIRDPLKLPD